MKRAPRLCGQPGCGALVRGEMYCNKHGRARPPLTPEILAAQRFYNSKAWRDLSRLILKSEPLCRKCKRDGHLAAATEVDHIVPLRRAPERRYDPGNLQPLCRKCHSQKTARETLHASN